MSEDDDLFDDVLATFEIPEDPKETAARNQDLENQNKPTTSKQYSKYSVQVHPNQKGNPLLKEISSWEFNEKLVPDYQVGERACVLFISIRYHNLKPEYIHERIKQLGKNFALRVLLVHIDIKEPHNALKQLTRICLLAELTLMLAWSYEEAGKIIHTYKMLENTPAEVLKEKSDEDSYQSIINSLTSIKTVNKTDAMNLLTNFGTIEQLVQASESKLNACFGLGPRKAKQLHKLFNEHFLK